MDSEDILLMRGASYLLPDPGGEVVRDLLNELDRVLAALSEAAKYGFVQGYNAGHDDAVEGWYVDPTEKAENWYEDAEADGSLKEIIDAAMARDGE